MVEIKRTVTKEVEETVTMDLKTYYVVRVIRIGNYNQKECIKEFEYPYEPDEQEIADALVEYMHKNVFATVVKNYRLVEVAE